MLELVKYVVETFAENKDAIVYDVTEDGRNVNITVTLDSSDMGKVIGRQGKIAKAIRNRRGAVGASAGEGRFRWGGSESGAEFFSSIFVQHRSSSGWLRISRNFA